MREMRPLPHFSHVFGHVRLRLRETSLIRLLLDLLKVDLTSFLASGTSFLGREAASVGRGYLL